MGGIKYASNQVCLHILEWLWGVGTQGVLLETLDPGKGGCLDYQGCQPLITDMQEGLHSRWSIALEGMRFHCLLKECAAGRNLWETDPVLHYNHMKALFDACA